MSVKKLLTLSVAGLAAIGAVSAMAGGPDLYAPPPPSFAGVYLEGNAGYALRSWKYDSGVRSNFFGFNHNFNGGFSAIVDLGYQFNEFLSLEAGWIYLPCIKGTAWALATPFNIFNPFVAGTNIRITSWSLYFGGKLTVPVPHWDGGYFFGKLAAAYVNNKSNVGLVPSNFSLVNFIVNSNVNNFNAVNHSNYWTPMYAFGVQYYFNPNLSINFQYTRLPGSHCHHTGRFGVPDADIFTLGLGYKFLT